MGKSSQQERRKGTIEHEPKRARPNAQAVRDIVASFAIPATVADPIELEVYYPSPVRIARIDAEWAGIEAPYPRD